MLHESVGTTGLVLAPVVLGTRGLGNPYHQIAKDVKLEVIKAVFKHLETPLFWIRRANTGLD